jgi:DNA-binding XRE family transcriptional regulator
VPETRGQQVIVLKPVDGSVAEIPKDFIDIDALVEQEERDPTVAASIATGRKVIAEAFYSGDSKTLAFYRMQKGWSQKRLAQEANTSQSYIARIENGDVDPQMSTARKIANALGITIEALDVALSSCKK